MTRPPLKSMRRAAPAAAAFWLLLAVSPAFSAKFGDIEITPRSMVAAPTAHGYVEHAFLVANHSPQRTHQLTIALPDRGFGYGDNDAIGRMSRTVTLSPGATMTLRLFQPPLVIDGRSQAAITIDGRTMPQTLPTDPFDHIRTVASRRAREEPLPLHLLMSPSMDHAAAQRTAGLTVTSAAGFVPGSRQGQIHPAKLPVAAWSDHWLAYSAFDAVVLTSAEYAAAPPAVRWALLAYMQAGGALVVAGATQPPEPLHTASTGFGHRLAFAEADVARWNTAPDPSTGAVKWSRQLDPSSGAVNWTASAQWDAIFASARRTVEPWQHLRTPAAAHAELPVIDRLGVPVRGMLALMLILALAMGPINIYLLDRMRRRIWLLWTVPAMSLVGCVAIFSYNLIAEGFGATGRVQSITVLDQHARRAASIGFAGFYAPLTPGDGLRFEADVELTAQLWPYQRHAAPRLRAIDWSARQHLDSAWLTARVPGYFMFRRAHAETRRVEIERQADGSLVATNALGLALHSLVYADARGRLHAATDIAPGARVALKSQEMAVPDPGLSAREVFAGDWIATMRNAAAEPRSLLRGGDYVAVTDRPPFMDMPLPSLHLRPDANVIHGTLGAAAP